MSGSHIGWLLLLFLDLVYGDEHITLADYHCVYSLRLWLGQGSLVSQLALHLVSSKVTRGDFTRPIEYSALTLLPVIAPFTIIDSLLGGIKEPTLARPLALYVFTNIDVPSLKVTVTTSSIFVVILPFALKH